MNYGYRVLNSTEKIFRVRGRAIPLGVGRRQVVDGDGIIADDIAAPGRPANEAEALIECMRDNEHARRAAENRPRIVPFAPSSRTA